MKMQPNHYELDADAIVELLDRLCASGSQHIHLQIGQETKVQTIRSTECCMQSGFCVPVSGGAPEEHDETL